METFLLHNDQYISVKLGVSSNNVILSWVQSKNWCHHNWCFWLLYFWYRYVNLASHHFHELIKVQSARAILVHFFNDVVQIFIGKLGVQFLQDFLQGVCGNVSIPCKKSNLTKVSYFIVFDSILPSLS